MPPETTYLMPSSIDMETSVSSLAGAKIRNQEVGLGMVGTKTLNIFS